PDLGTESMERILESNEVLAMPQQEGPGDHRRCGDVYFNLGHLLLAWQDSGFADDFDYTPCQSTGGDEDQVVTGSCGAAEDPYVVTPELAAKQTSLGTCIPEVLPPSSPVCSESDLQAKDAIFAAASSSEDLPTQLRNTELVT